MSKFVGRHTELRLLKEVSLQGGSKLTAVYGRRRIGKTRLIEEAYQKGNFIKFEGLENRSATDQRKHFKDTLARVSNKKIYQDLNTDSWKNLLIHLSEYIGQTETVILFDEFQWMAGERTNLVSTLKYVWDNYFLKNNKVHLIICGSVSSFIVKKVIQSRALYGRIDLKMHIQPLSLKEIREGFFPESSHLQAVEYWMTLGGVPKYLELCDPDRSYQQNILELFFHQYASLVDEEKALFVSHFGRNPVYAEIIQALSEKQFLSREQISKELHVPNGGTLSSLLEELQLAGFIDTLHSIHRLDSKSLRLYRISDPFLRFYFKFVKPKYKKIIKQKKPLAIHEALPAQKYSIWKGFAFEYFCHAHADEIAEILGFSAVEYDYGSFFTRADIKNLIPGAQIDLLYKRADGVVVVCEIKFQKNVTKSVIEEVDKKLESLPSEKYSQHQVVLISAYSPPQSVSDSGFFYKILDAESFFYAGGH